MSSFSNRHYHIQDIKYVQHENVNMTWYYWKFPRHPLSVENFKTQQGILFFHVITTGLIQNLVKLFVRLSVLRVYVQAMLTNLINIGYQLFLHHLNQSISMLKIVTIAKYLNITMIGSSCNSQTTRYLKFSLTTSVHSFLQ